MKKLLIALVLCFMLSSPVYAWDLVDTFYFNVGNSVTNINLWRAGVDYSNVNHIYLQITGVSGTSTYVSNAIIRPGASMFRRRYGPSSYDVPTGHTVYSGADNGAVIYFHDANPVNGRECLIDSFLSADFNVIDESNFTFNAYPGNYQVNFTDLNFVERINSEGWLTIQVKNVAGFVTLSSGSEINYIDYCIEFESFNETLVQDNTWLHRFFYQELAWEDGWRFNTTVRIKDANGNNVAGWLYPITSTVNAIEVLGFQWPLRQFKTFFEINYPLIEVDIRDRTFYIDDTGDGTFENINFVAKGLVPGRANETLFWIFEPEDWMYKNAGFYFALDEYRANIVSSQEYVYWVSPYKTSDYLGTVYSTGDFGFKYSYCVGDDDFIFQDIYDDLDDMTQEEFQDYLDDIVLFPDGWRDTVPSIDGDDRVRAGSVYGKMQERIEEFGRILSGRAPFGYLALIIAELQEFGSAFDTENTSITIAISSLPLFENDITFDLFYSEFAAVYGYIRLFSGWVLYSMLGIFFFTEYKKITGSGGGE